MQLNKHIVIRNLLFTFYLMYLSQGFFYNSGGIISQTILFSILAISAAYFIKTILLKNKHNPFYYGWSLLLVLNVIGFIITFNFDIFHYAMFKNILVVLLTFYPFYFYTKNNLLRSKNLFWFFIFMLLISIFQFFSSEELIKDEIGNENVVNNIGYLFVGLIPYLFLIKRKTLFSSFLMAVILFFIISSNKRGALLTAGLGTMLFAYGQFIEVEKGKRFKTYIVALAVVAILGYFAYYYYLSNEFFISRMTAMLQGDTSKRRIIFEKILIAWFNTDNFLHVLFGFGFASSVKISGGNYAHNDWLELLSNFGLIGVSIYFFLFYTLFKLLRNKDWNIEKRLLLLTIVSMWLLITTFSMWYTSLWMSTQAILLAYLIGSDKNILD